MNDNQKHRSNLCALLLILGGLVLVRLLFIWLMPATFSHDMRAWPRLISVLREGKNPYTNGHFNYPPFWMQVLYVIDKASEITSIPVIRLIQLALITAEAMVVALSWLMLEKFFAVHRPVKQMVVAYAISPIFILLNCQHGNIDIIVALWILLFIYALFDYIATQAPVSWLMACFFLGIGILTKTIPVMLLPLLAIGFSGRNLITSFFGLMLVFTPIVLGMSIVYVLEPAGVSTHVLGYRSLAGWYGITGFLGWLEAERLTELYSKVSPWVMMGLLAFFTWFCLRKAALKIPDVLRLALLLLIFIPTFGPGYSPPYILWFLPLLILLYFISSPATRVFLLAGYAITTLTYITEYAFFNSHGAFMFRFFPGPQMEELCGMLGSKRVQVLIRVPMFVFFVSLYFLLIRDLRRSVGKPGMPAIVA